MTAVPKMPPHFEIERKETSDGLVFFVNGVIDEHSSFEVFDLKGVNLVTFDLAGIKMINSVGIREWVRWLRSAARSNLIMRFRNCAKVIVDQMSVLEGFVPRNTVVESFFVPYVCNSCEQTQMVLYREGQEFFARTADCPARVAHVSENVTCESCRGGKLEIDVMESKYFRFLFAKSN